MDIFRMKLHEALKIGCMTVTRVPGGWIYEIPRGNTQRVTSQFVPFKILDEDPFIIID